METVRDDPSMNRTFTVRRKATKRTFPWDLAADEIQLALPRPQDEDEDIRAINRPRLEEPVPTSIDEATTEKTSHDTAVALPAPPGVAAADDDNSDPMADTHPIARIIRMTRYWTPEEDAKLTSAVTETCKKKWGKDFKSDWAAIAALVQGRTYTQCRNRWRDTLDPSIKRANRRTGRWEEDEDIRLKAAVRTHGGKDWAAIAAQVQGRNKNACRHRWHDALDPSIDRTPGCSGKWTTGEDTKLKDAVRVHGGKNWEKIATFVPSRTKKQCSKRWYDTFASIIDTAAARVGKWTANEDTMLKDAVRAHGTKNWDKIAALVPGRTGRQCGSRLRKNLDPDRSTAAGEEEHDNVNKASTL
jgi:hypothetical protein